MTLQTNLENFATRIATQFKRVENKIGAVENLSTSDKQSLVAAINEIKTTSASLTQVAQMIATAKSEIIGGAGNLYDTLKEIQDLLAADDAADASAIAGLTGALANRVRTDAAQNLSDAQKAQALTNIGGVSSSDIGNPNTDFVAIFNAALL